MPFIALITNNLMCNQSTLANKVGPVRLGMCAGSQHPISADWPTARNFGFKVLTRTLLNIGRWRIAGDHTRSILIDSDTGKPVVEPYTLNDTERKVLYTA